jgi:hypothetical protein
LVPGTYRHAATSKSGQCLRVGGSSAARISNPVLPLPFPDTAVT